MGHWYTAHLFDYKAFENSGIHDLLNDENQFKIICQIFLEQTPFFEDGKSLSLEEKVKKVDGLYEEYRQVLTIFRKDLSLNELKGNENDKIKREYIKSVYNYHFARFFNFLLFYKYVDYYPFVIVGKHGLLSKFESSDTLGFEILMKLDQGIGNNYFSIEGYGIIGWLTAEETILLNMDIDKLIFKPNSYFAGFFNLLKIAKKENLGIIFGVDMVDDSAYRRISNNMINQKDYNIMEIEGLNFED